MKKWISMILVVCMLLTIAPMPALAEETQYLENGACGEKAAWALDSEGVLYLGGEGAVDGYAAPDAEQGVQPPWSERRAEIREVRILEGVQELGENAFAACAELECVYLPVSLEKIGDGAFDGCAKLAGLFYAGTEEQWLETPLEAGDQAQALAVLPMEYETAAEHAHLYGDGEITLEPTCTEAGEQRFACVLCSEERIEAVDALDHAWDEGVITTEPGCETEGEKTFTCERCGETRTETVPAIGEHAWDEGVITTEPGCETEGEKTFTCERCGETRTETVPAIGEHAWDEGVVTTEPSCETEGEKTFTCERCGETRTETVPAIGEHAWDEGVVTTEPGCDSEGVKTFTCTRCGETKTESVPVTGHSWHYQSGSGPDHHYVVRTCENCGKEYRIDTTDELIVQNGECGTDAFYAFTSGNKLYYFGCGSPTNAPVTGAEHVYFSRDLKSVSGVSFKNDKTVQEVRVETPGAKLGYDMFQNCTSLTDVYLPDSAVVTFGEASAMENGTIYTFVGSNITLHITRDTGTVAEYYLSGTIRNSRYYSVCNGVRRVIVEEGVEAIGAHAFERLKSSIEFQLPASLRSVGESAFAYAIGVPKMTLLGGFPQHTDALAFYQCNALTDLTVAEPSGSLEELTIGKNVFSACPGITDEVLNGVFASAKRLTVGENAFNSCYSIRALTFGAENITIQSGAFQSCSQLSSISFEGCTDLDCSGFLSNDNLTSITFPSEMNSLVLRSAVGRKAEQFQLPDHVGSIQLGNVFYGNKNLESIRICADTCQIDLAAFSGCTNLKELALPDNTVFSGTVRANTGIVNSGNSSVTLTILNTTGAVAQNFLRDSSNSYSVGLGVSKIVIEPGITEVCAKAFYGAKDVQEIVLPESVTVIGDSAFRQCSALEEFPDWSHIQKLDSCAFADCTSVTHVDYPYDVASCGNGMFKGCTGLTELIIDRDNAVINTETFSGCTGLELVVISGKNVKLYPGAILFGTKNIDVYLPDSTQLIRTYYRSEGFFGFQYTMHVMKDTGKVRDEFAFLTSLASQGHPVPQTWPAKITFEEGITEIGNFAFQDSPAAEIVFPESLTLIGERAFGGCAVRELSFPGESVSLGGYAFSGCNGLTELYYTANLHGIGKGYAFENCGNLQTVSIASGASLGKDCFYRCKNLQEVQFEDMNTSVFVGEQAFYLCTSIPEINLPRGSNIGSHAFWKCTSLQTITAPACHFNGQGALSDCSALESVYATDTTTFYDARVSRSGTGSDTATLYIECESGVIPDYMFHKDGRKNGGHPGATGGFKKIVLGEGITEIGEYAFRDNITPEIVLPESLQTIAPNAFRGCKMASVTLPRALQSIGNYAFYGSPNLESVTLSANLRSIPTSVFAGCPKLEKIVIPATVTEIGDNAVGFDSAATIIDADQPDTADNYRYTYTKLDGFAVYGYTGTEAERYAEKCDLVFVPLDDNTDYDEETLRFDAAGAHLYGANLRLEGDIGINFFFELSSACLADETAMVKITLPDGSAELHPVSGLTVNMTSVPGKTLYVVRCYVRSYEMTGDICAQIIRRNSSLSGAEYHYSVYRYINNILSKDSYSEEVKEVVRTLANYGAKAQLYFGQYPDQLADQGVDLKNVPQAMESLTAEELAQYATSKTPMPEGISYYGASLVLNSATSVRYFFDVADGHEIGEYTFSCGGKTLTPVMHLGHYMVEIQNILAYDLDDPNVITVSDGTSSGAASYSALSYVYNTLRKNPNPETDSQQKLVELVKAIYLYHQAAKAYFGV